VTGERVLVTGAPGLIGRATVPRLREGRVEVHEVSRRVRESARSHAVDLTDTDAALELVGRVSPTVIIHLAGGHQPTSAGLHAANTQTAVNVMNGAVRLAVPPRVVLLGSSAEYGEPLGGVVSESSATEPVTQYGREKLEATTRAQMIAAASDIPICVVRPFNIVSPELPQASALGNMRRQLLSGRGRSRVVQCGRLDVVRDFVPIEAVVSTLLRLLEVDVWPVVLNVCSGTPVILGDLLEAMARSIDVELEVVLDPQLAAIPSAARLVGDPSRLRDFGVVCQPTVEELASQMMERAADVDGTTIPTSPTSPMRD
jgi:nucleoside-diphosphate-sugar epimerase